MLDVIAESQNGKYLLVGECKWQEKILNTNGLLNEIKEKAGIIPFAKNKKIVPVLFLKTKPREQNVKNVFLPEDVLKAFL